MRVIIVDDEITSSQVLDKLIQHYLPMLQVIAICNKPADAIEKIAELNPDLVFMDIELPGMTGFDILEKINPIHFNIIFTTAHSQYGIKAIQFSAIDYLLKPINIDELKQAVARVSNYMSQNHSLERIKILLENIQLLHSNNPFNRIALPTNEGLKFVYTNDIVRCMSSNNYTYIFFKNGEKILISKTLKEVENIFSTHSFCRVHNSHLVNTQYIKKFIKSDINTIIMTDGAEVEVSRRKKDELLKILNL
ncbi:MAG: response regulator transcription factor [Bacteroidetes bacterium]|jgi:two-component system LytT family response regulator|nr:response regulator transcription factor [Bacteroidota bacterium]